MAINNQNKQDIEHQLWFRVPATKVPGTTPIDEKFWSLLRPGSMVLEVGCGDGRIIYECIKRGFAVIGIDINAAAIKKLRAGIKKMGTNTVSLDVSSITKTKFNKDFFNAATLQGILSALSTADRVQALHELWRILKPNAIIHIAEFEFIDNNVVARARYDRDYQITKEYGTISVTNDLGTELYRTHNFKEAELRSLLEATGFTIISFRREIFTSYHGNRKPGLLIILKK